MAQAQAEPGVQVFGTMDAMGHNVQVAEAKAGAQADATGHGLQVARAEVEVATSSIQSAAAEVASQPEDSLPSAGEPVIFTPASPAHASSVYVLFEIPCRRLSFTCPLIDAVGKSPKDLVRFAQAELAKKLSDAVGESPKDEFFRAAIYREGEGGMSFMVEWVYPTEPLPLIHNDYIVFYPSKDPFQGRCGRMCRICKPGQDVDIQCGKDSFWRRCAYPEGHFQSVHVCDRHVEMCPWAGSDRKTWKWWEANAGPTAVNPVTPPQQHGKPAHPSSSP